MTSQEYIHRLLASPAFSGDPNAWRLQASAASEPDPVLEIAFEPADAASFPGKARALLAARGVQAPVAVGGAPGAAAGAGQGVTLYKHFPGGVARLPGSALLALLDAGLIRCFEWPREYRAVAGSGRSGERQA